MSSSSTNNISGAVGSVSAAGGRGGGGGGGGRGEEDDLSDAEWELEEGYESPGGKEEPESSTSSRKKEPTFIKRRFIGTNSTHIKMAFVGAPNVGKSSLFNMFINKDLSPVEDSIFSTTELFYGTLTPYDYKYEYYNSAYKPAISTRSQVSVFDTPAIVKGSATGAMLGIPDISLLKDVDVLLFVVRGFGGDEVTNFYDEEVNPVNEYFVLMNELMLKDLQIIDEALYQADLMVNLNKGGRLKAFERFVLHKAWELLFGKKKPEFKKTADPKYRYKPDSVNGRPLKSGTWDNNEIELLSKLDLWTTKEVVILLNVNRREYLSQISDWVEPLKRSINSFEQTSSTAVITVSVEFEDLLRNQIHEVATTRYNLEKRNDKDYPLSFADMKKVVLEEHLAANPLQCSALATVIKESLNAIQVIHFHTYTNRDSKTLSEFKSWAIRQGTTTSEAASIIDTTIHRNLIRGDIIEFEEFYLYDNNKYDGVDAELKLVFDQKVRNKGKKYVINDGDLVAFSYLTKDNKKK